MRMNNNETASDGNNNDYGDDESTLQPPPSDDMGDIDIDAIDYDDDEEAPSAHDQLPSPEEYKAKMMNGGNSSSSLGSRFFGGKTKSDNNNPQDGEYDNGVGIVDGNDDHNQLPSVDEYKSSMTFSGAAENNNSNKKSRAGLYTFLALLLVTIIATSIAVPLVLDNERDPFAGSSNNSQVNTGSSTSGSSPSSSTGTTPTTPYYPPTFAPAPPPVSITGSVSSPTLSSDTLRLERTLDYLRSSGVATMDDLDRATSPQAEAAVWIATKDEFKMDIPSITTSASSTSENHSRFIERWTLAVFYYSTSGPIWRYNLKFMEPIDHCDWYETFIDTTGSIVRMGVTLCERLGTGFGEQQNEDQMVSRIELSNNGLAGSLPVQMQYLHRLEDLILPFNAGLIDNASFNGLLPLSLLKHLELQYCGMEGALPDDIGNLQSLTFLGLGNNFLEGTIPESFFELTNLVVLGLDDNLLQSPIAPFAKFTNIEKLYIEDNEITGQITEEIIRDGWQKMIDLDVSVNRLVGPIPANIWSMLNMEVLDLHGNDFVGAIPEIEAVHDKMMFLAVNDNTLDWRIPETISNLINLAHLDISANNMEIPFPSTMNQLGNLRSLYTGINNFEEHTIPSFLEGMTNLKELSMKQNKLTGTIPGFLGGLTNLQVLDFDFNMLEGSLPFELGSLTGLDTLMLNRNYLNGTIPESFASLDDIDILLLDGNNLTGSADMICKDATINTTFFSADCGEPNPEIECTCCHLCCHDNNATCNNFDWRVNLDGIWEYDFERVVYSFSQNLLPSEAKADYTQTGAQPEEVGDDSI